MSACKLLHSDLQVLDIDEIEHENRDLFGVW